MASLPMLCALIYLPAILLSFFCWCLSTLTRVFGFHLASVSIGQCVSELAEVRSWADERIAAQTEQMELQSEEAKVVASRSKEETKAEVARLMEVRRQTEKKK